jgi:hypothetical protein
MSSSDSDPPQPAQLYWVSGSITGASPCPATTRWRAVSDRSGRSQCVRQARSVAWPPLALNRSARRSRDAAR